MTHKVFGYFLVPVSFGYWILVIGYFPDPVSLWLLVINLPRPHPPLVIGHWLLVINLNPLHFTPSPAVAGYS
jgi:hypothetical protein